LLPVYITEYGLKILRDFSRWLAAFNTFALNALENRVSYVVGKGFGYQAVPAKSGRAADRILCQRAQEVIDRFLERTDWGELEQEVMRRADRDGEAFLRFFHTGHGECTVRTVEPEHVRSPGDQSAHLSFGIETPEHDIQDALAYWIVEEPSLSWTPTRVPADEIVHVRFNVDRTAKRGYPTLVPVRRNLLRADKLLQNMSTLAQVQATFALIRKHKQYSASAVQTWQQGQADIAVSDPVSGNTRYLQRYLPGTILDVPEQTDYEFPAAKVPADSLVAVLQAELRAVAARLVLPEYMLTSNAANANYASTLVAEAPAVKHFERLQRQLARKFGDGRYGGPGHCGALWRVLEHAVEWGGLPSAVLERVALHVEPPSPVARDKDKETARAASLNQAGVLSKATWSKWEGLDRARERRQLEQEKQATQPQGGRDHFTESVRRVLEACQPHKSGRYKGTKIGYDPDKHNANCRLTGTSKRRHKVSKKAGQPPAAGEAPAEGSGNGQRQDGVATGTPTLVAYANPAQAAAPAPTRPWTLKANWADATGALTMTSQQIQINVGKGSEKQAKDAEDYVWNGLKEFKSFNGSKEHPNIATVRLIEPDKDAIENSPNLKGSLFAEFTTLDPLKARAQQRLSGDGPNGEVYVRLFVDEEAHRITAVTLGHHMIVGIRQWQVSTRNAPRNILNFANRDDHLVVVQTTAWEQRNGLITDLGFKAVGKEDMMDVWHNYLGEIARDLDSHTKERLNWRYVEDPVRELPA
jgi:hypothetical protein